MRIKKLICSLLAVLMLTSAISTQTFAQTVSSVQTGTMSVRTLSGYTASNNTAAVTAIGTAIRNCEKSIDVSNYNITIDELRDLYMDVTIKYPELYYMPRSFKYNSDSTQVYFLYLTYPSYVDDATQFAATKTKFNNGIAQALACVNSNMTNAEKALAVHDYLVRSAAYVMNVTPDPDSVYSAYGILVNHQGVCQGYALTYQILLSRMNIPVTTVVSNPMNHAWNMVQIDGQWYHVDNTFDDAVDSVLEKDIPGQVLHNDFLLSDAGITKAGHYEWSSDAPIASSTTYDNYYWKNIESNMYYKNGQWYFLKNGDLMKCTFDGAYQTVINTNGSAVLALNTANDSLIYATTNQIRQINFDGTNDKLLFSFSSISMVTAIAAANNKITYTIALSSGDYSTASFDYKTSEVPIASVSSVSKGSILIDTKTYTLAPNNVYTYKITLVGAAANEVKTYSSRPGIATVKELSRTVVNGKIEIRYQIKGLRASKDPVTVLCEVRGTHASVKVMVTAGVKQSGTAGRVCSLF